MELIDRFEAWKMAYDDEPSSEAPSTMTNQTDMTGLTWDFGTMRLSGANSMRSIATARVSDAHPSANRQSQRKSNLFSNTSARASIASSSGLSINEESVNILTGHEIGLTIDTTLFQVLRAHASANC